MKTLETTLNSINNENSVQLMQNTSRRTIQQLRDIYHQVDGDKHGLVIAVYGSLARYEMLPLSDMDILLFAENNEIIPRIKDLITQLDFDFLDFPSEDYLNLGNLKQFALSNSPDGHVVALHIVAGSQSSRIYNELIAARDMGNHPDLMLENLIFNYHYINYTAKRKVNPLGANLKYSPGGARDMIYFDWTSDFLTNCGTTNSTHTNEVPQISYSIPIVANYLGEIADSQSLSSCINFINTIKNQALLLKAQGDHFDGLMSEITARHILSNYDYANVGSASDLIKIHTDARAVIYKHRQMIYAKIIDYLQSKAKTSEFYKRLLDIAIIWDDVDVPNKNEIIARLIESGRWADIATVACQADATSDNIDLAVDAAVVNPTYAHLFRVAITHKNTSEKSLQKILRHSQIAGSSEIDQRYQRIIRERLGK